MTSGKYGGTWLRYSGIAVSAVLLVVLFYIIDRQTFAASIARVGLTPLVVATICSLLSFFALACRFGRAVGRYLNVQITGRELLRDYVPAILAANFLAHGLSVGGDVARLVFLRRNYDLPYRVGVSILVVDRLVGISMASIFAVVSFAIVFWSAPWLARIATLGVLVLFGMAIVFIARAIVKSRFPDWILIRAIVQAYVGGTGAVVEQTVISLSAVIGVAISLFVVSNAIGVELPFGIAAAAAPIIYVASSIPITYAGWGSREVSCVAVLSGAGWMTAADAMSVSITVGLSMFIATLPGILAFRPKGCA